MQRWLITGILVLIVVLGIGTLTTTPPEPGRGGGGYAIVFDGMPKLYNDHIFLSNEIVGKIQSKIEGTSGVVKMMVDLNAEFVDQVGNSIAFYPDHGRLSAVKLQTAGESLPKDAVLCGFSSKGALNWFKLKTIFSNRVTAAGRRTEALLEKSGLS
jgi:hypothetical protein